MSLMMQTSHGSNLAGGTVGQVTGTVKSDPHKLYAPSGKPVYTANRRCAGWLYNEGNSLVFRKDVTEAKHLFRKGNAWGIDSTVLDYLRQLGVKTIRIIAKDTKVIEEAALEEFDRHAFERDLGFGPQKFLPRSRFTRVDLQQLSLFEGVG